MNDMTSTAVRPRKRPMKLSTTVTLMVCSVIGSVLLLAFALWFWQISNATRDGVKETALAVCHARRCARGETRSASAPLTAT